MIINSNRVATTVVKTETSVLSVLGGLRWHQIDAGTASSGTLSVQVNFGTGLREIATIDFADSSRLPVLIFGDVIGIQLVPSTVDVNYSVVYISIEEG